MKWLLIIFFYKVIMQLFLRIYVGVKWINTQNLQVPSPYIIVSNHNSHLDTMSVMAALPINQLIKTHPVAAADYFGKNMVTRFLSRYVLNAILIKRQRTEGDPSPTDIMLGFLERGHSLLLFPEGSRGEPEKIQSFQKGIGALLFRRANTPYIPIFMKGMGRVLPKGEKLLVPFDSYVSIGSVSYTKETEVTLIVKEVEEAVRKQGDVLLYLFNQ
ncbi:MAG: lysophospholipid acyltransferase family protein [Flavobacteriales bacterium]